MKLNMLIFYILMAYVLIASLYFTFLKILPFYFIIIVIIYFIVILLMDYMGHKIGVKNE